MIPTSYRDKLPEGLSYPINASAINDALAHIDNPPTTTMTFCALPTFRASDFKHILNTGTAYPILTVVASSLKPGHAASNKIIKEGFYEPNWQVYIYPVRSALRHGVKEDLVSRGLPAVREWLIRSHHASHHSGRQSFSIIFNPTNGKTSYE